MATTARGCVAGRQDRKNIRIPPLLSNASSSGAADSGIVIPSVEILAQGNVAYWPTSAGGRNLARPRQACSSRANCYIKRPTGL
jgi:hypothetical protein